MNITQALEQIERNFQKAAETIRAERDAIAKSICVTLDDGTAPDNLADHVELLVLQEYYPAKEEIERLRRQVEKLTQDHAMETEEFNAGYQAFEAGLDVTSAEIEYRSVLPAESPSYDVFRVGYAWAKECHQVNAND